MRSLTRQTALRPLSRCRWAPFLIVTSTLAAGACSSPATNAPDPVFSFVRRIADAEGAYDELQFRSVRKDGQLTSPVTIEGETRFSLTPPVPSKLSYRVEIPTDPVLALSVAVSPIGSDFFHAAIEFNVFVDTGEGDELAFSEVILPDQPNQWMRSRVELDRFAGKSARVTFDTKLSAKYRSRPPSSRQQAVLASWGDPVLRSETTEPDGSNLILVSIDCLRADHLSAYGYEHATTPNLDAVADEGVLYENAYASASWTLPAHMSMLTGLLPSFHGATKWEKLSTSVPYLPELLAGQGYRTAGIVSWVYLSQVYGFERGFDSYRVLDAPRASDIVDAAIEELGRGKGQNLFLFLHLYDPHWPYMPPREFHGRFGPRPGDISELMDFMAEAKTPDTEAKSEEIIRLYDGEIAFADRELGRFFRALRQRGVYDDALLILTSDHGEAFYEHGHWQHTQTLYDEVTRTPLIVKWPGGKVRGRDRRLASQVDIFATLAKVAGIETSETEKTYWEGRSLQDAPERDRTLLSEVTWRSPKGTLMKAALRDAAKVHRHPSWAYGGRSRCLRATGGRALRSALRSRGAPKPSGAGPDTGWPIPERAESLSRSGPGGTGAPAWRSRRARRRYA